MENEILKKLDSLAATLESLESKIQIVDSRVSGVQSKLFDLDSKVSELDHALSTLDFKANTLSSQLDNVTARLINIEEKINEQLPTKIEVNELEDRIATHIDGFIQLHQKIDIEQVALLGKYHRHKERIAVIENKLNIAS